MLAWIYFLGFAFTVFNGCKEIGFCYRKDPYITAATISISSILWPLFWGFVFFLAMQMAWRFR